MDPVVVNAEVLEGLCRDLEATAAKRGWDQPPVLFMIADGLMVKVPLFESPAIRKLLRRGERPPDILATFAEKMDMDPNSALAPPDLIDGWAFLHEGWMVEATPKEKETPWQRALDEALLKEQSAAHQLHQHPRRMEVRMVAASVRGGVDLLVTRVRGRSADVYPLTVSGYVFDSLHQLVAALK